MFGNWSIQFRADLTNGFCLFGNNIFRRIIASTDSSSFHRLDHYKNVAPRFQINISVEKRPNSTVSASTQLRMALTIDISAFASKARPHPLNWS